MPILPSTGTFSGLIEPDEIGRVTLDVMKAIEESFFEDARRNKRAPCLTGSEVRRRFDICEKIFKVLRGDLKWGLARIGDHLTQYLRAELDGTEWTPGTRTFWLPKDGRA